MPGKRRISKKRSRRVKHKKLSAISLAKLQSRPRFYSLSVTSEGVQTITNQKTIKTMETFFSAGCPGSLNSCESILASVGRETMGSSTDAGGVIYYIYKNLVNLNLRNMESEACIAYVYVFTNKDDLFARDLTTDINTVGKAMIADLVRGWDISSANANVNLIGTGDTVIYTQGNDECQLLTDQLYPYNSVGFLDKWKIVKKAGRKLQPGDDWMIGIKVPAQKYDPIANLNIQSGTLDRGASGYNEANAKPICKKGMARLPVIFLRGIIGKDTVTVGKYGWMTTDVYCGIRQTAQVLKLTSNQGTNLAMVVNQDSSFTAGGLGGPSDFTQKVDDADD